MADRAFRCGAFGCATVCTRFGGKLAAVCGIFAVLLLCSSARVEAAWITKQDVTWNTDWLPTAGSIVHSPVTDPTVNGSPMFIFGSGWNPGGWDAAQHKTVGELFAGQVKTNSGENRTINLGPGLAPPNFTGGYNNLYSEIELSWGSFQGTPLGFKNLPGNDLAIYENGYPPLKDNAGNWRGGSDVFLVSLGYVENGSLKWTGYRYTVPTSYEPLAQWFNTDDDPDDGNFGEGTSWASGPTYLTLIDAGDFGLPLGTWITAVRVRNGVYLYDEPEVSGSGWVTLNSSNSPLNPFKDENGEITTYLHPKYDTYSPRYDPDITVVVPLRQVMPIPEPGLAIALYSGLGAFLPVYLAGRRWRRVG